MNSFLLFHLNLSFSSVEEHQHKSILQKCYYPLLNLPKKHGIKIAIEASGATIERLNFIDPYFLSELKELISNQLVEFIGSSYYQSIFPLNPYELNKLNLDYGRSIYNELLNSDPTTALINEMSFSRGLIDLYLDDGYQSIITDIDNIQNHYSKKANYNFTQLKSITGKRDIGIIWADSILFQHFQRYIHGENTLGDYLNIINLYKQKKLPYLPIYSNDAEVFNFRPGRFSAEKKIINNEWDRIYQLIEILKKDLSLKFCFPKEIDKSITLKNSKTLSKISSGENPVIVKKQPKYNINRWSLSGRDDQFQNMIIQKLSSKLSDHSIKNSKDNIKKILSFSSSDLRTHITEKRWKKHQKALKTFTKKHKLRLQNKQFSSVTGNNSVPMHKILSYPEIAYDGNKYLSINTPQSKTTLNLLKGGAIQNLSFSQHNFRPTIISKSAGEYDSIKHGVDYFSSLLLAELPLNQKKITDLSQVKPFFHFDEKAIKVFFQQELDFFDLQKVFSISRVSNEVSISYQFRGIKPFIGYLRVGNFILNHDQRSNIIISSKIGSHLLESFKVNEMIDHQTPVSTFVSSSSGIPSTDGITEISFFGKKNGLRFSYDNEHSYAVPMLKYFYIGSKTFLRLVYSLREFDDTAKPSSNILPINIKITPL